MGFANKWGVAVDQGGDKIAHEFSDRSMSGTFARAARPRPTEADVRGLCVLAVAVDPSGLERLRAAGHSVLVREEPHGLTDLVSYTSAPWDVLLLGWLPGDNESLLFRFRELFPTCVVIAVAAEVSPALKIAALRAGSADCVTAPVDVAEVQARVEAQVFLRSMVKCPNISTIAGKAQDLLPPSGHAAPEVEPSAFSFRPADGILRFAGKQIQLTRIETLIFSILAEHPGSIVPRVDVIRAIWPNAGLERSRLLDVHVRNLRSKLGAKVIEAARGQGLCLVVPAMVRSLQQDER